MVRKIQDEMFQYIDAKLVMTDAGKKAIADKNARELFALALECCVGIREEGGNNKGKLVELIQKTIGDAERESWCMSFQQTGIAYVERKLGIVSKYPVSEHCLTCWQDAPAELRVHISPLRGAIVIWQHGKTSNGHTGMVRQPPIGDSFNAVEGNTEGGFAANGAIERDGGGVYYTHRSTNGNGDMRVKGYLKPF